VQAPSQAVRSIRHPLARALLVMTFSTGLVDAVSYLGLGRVFTANMTGNVVLLGFVLTMTLTGLAAESPFAGGSGQGSVRRIAAVVAMLCGAVAGALLLKISLVPPLAAAAALALLVALGYVPFAARQAN
jgi:uncharacterized membrane protein YoaK (UPF0700 family)